MNQATSYLLIAFGLGLTGYLALRDKPDEERHLAEVTRITMLDEVKDEPDAGGAEAARRWDAAGAPILHSEPDQTRKTTARRRQTDAPDISATAAVAPELKPWTTVVSTTRQDFHADRIAVAQAAPDRETHSALTFDIQAELKRVGCYAGPIDGRWNESTRRAMGDFVRQANASLPIEQPDYVLLALAQAHKGGACEPCLALNSADPAACSASQTVVAEAPARPKRTARGKRRPPLPSEPLAAATETQTATAEVLPWAAPPAATAETNPQRAGTRPPLEGRMAIGGPVDATAPSPSAGTSKFDTLAALESPREAAVLPVERRAVVVPLPGAVPSTAKAKAAKPSVRAAALQPAQIKKVAKRKFKRGRPMFYYSNSGWGRRNAYRRRGYDGSMTLWGMF